MVYGVWLINRGERETLAIWPDLTSAQLLTKEAEILSRGKTTSRIYKNRDEALQHWDHFSVISLEHEFDLIHC